MLADCACSGRRGFPLGGQILGGCVHGDLGLGVEEGVGKLLTLTEGRLDNLKVADVGQVVLDRLVGRAGRAVLDRMRGTIGAIGATGGGVASVASSAHGCDCVCLRCGGGGGGDAGDEVCRGRGVGGNQSSGINKPSNG